MSIPPQVLLFQGIALLISHNVDPNTNGYYDGFHSKSDSTTCSNSPVNLCNVKCKAKTNDKCCIKEVQKQLAITGCSLQTQNQRLYKKLHKIKKSLACSTSIPICRKAIGHKGFFIDHPGEYCLTEDVFFTTSSPNVTSAIVINSSNVVLNLNNKTLSSDHSGLTVGVLVNGHSNIIVKSGSIRGFSVNGIRVNTGNRSLNSR